MQTYVNPQGIALAILPWLVRDTYDHNDDPFTLSATYFNRSIRQMVLERRKMLSDTKPLVQSIDVATMAASRMGTAIHDSIEAAWYDDIAVAAACKLAGLPKKVSENILVNPEEGTSTEGKFVVRMEQRLEKKLKNYLITGKFDFIINGELTDFKSTSAFKVTGMLDEENYIRQGSIYRWLNPELITSSILSITFIVKDFAQKQAGKNGYPASATPTYQFPLWEPAVTEKYLADKLDTVEKLLDSPDEDIPYCTPTELWQGPPVYKYYANPEKTVRATKNFDNMQDAELMKISRGAGIVIVVQDPPRACNWCSVRFECNQYAEMNIPEEPTDELSPD